MDKPGLSGVVVNKNTLSITWKKVTGGQTYVLERKTAKIGYTVISQTDSTRLSLTDDKLVENTNYTYRLKVYGKNTESVYDSISMVTPDFLATPVLSLEENVANKSIKVSWKAIVNANSYTIERQTAGADTTYYLVGQAVRLNL